MRHFGVSRAYVVAVAAAVFALLVVQIATAGGAASAGDPTATASGGVKKKLKNLQRQIDELKAQLGTPGPPGAPGAQGPQGGQGAQGPAGSAPACAGNGSGDTMVSAGSVCIDRYEVSVWSSPTGGTQYGASSDNYPCNDNGQDCEAGTAGEIYARSVAGVTPSRFITYFQAQQALANSGKRLPSNAEWQQAVAGTPDPGTDNGTTDCNVSSTLAVANTGSRSSCISNHGANDMVGNLWERVGDWDEQAAACANWPAGFGTDLTCLGRGSGEASTRFPGALLRGGDFFSGSDAGPFAVRGDFRPWDTFHSFGFRGAR